jgi:hypothetical protein
LRPSDHIDALVPELLLAEWVHGELPPETVPALAVRALSEGCDTPTLRYLAGESEPLTRAELDQHVLRCFTELGLATPKPGDATAFLINQWASLIAAGKVTPYHGAKRIWLLSHEWWDRPEWDQLSIFVGLASEWEDYPPNRADFEAAIVDEAEKLLREGAIRAPSD